MPSRQSYSELAYLDGILVAGTIVVIVEGEINYRLRASDGLPDGREIMIVEIRHFCLLQGIDYANRRDRLVGYRKALKSTVMH